jgi:shikimate kinase
MSPQHNSTGSRESSRDGEVRAVVLIGFMGAGKTSVGQELATILGWRFVDLDDRITAREGRSAPQIFAESGEKAFRAAESAALAEVLGELGEGQFCVLSLGGGAFAQPANRDAIKAASLPVFWLDAPVEELAERIGGGGDRPLAQDPDHFRHLYEQRQAHYNQADVRIDTSGVPVREVAERIVALLRRGRSGRLRGARNA